MPEWVDASANVVIAVLGVGGLIFWIGQWVGRINERNSDFRKTMEGIGTDVGSIKEIAVRHFSNVSQSASPAKLTDFGKQVSAGAGAPAWAKQVANEMAKHYRGLEAFEVDQQARDIANRRQTPETKRVVAKAMYEYALDEASVRSILAIELRDAILRQLGIEPPAS